MRKIKILGSILFLLASITARATDSISYVKNNASKGSFPLKGKEKVANLLLDSNDFKGVHRVANHLKQDLKKVTGEEPIIFFDTYNADRAVVIIGTLGQSKLIDDLVKSGKIDGSLLKGKWEKFIIQQVQNPLPGFKQALVIAGSDKRGTIYGMYDLSTQIGVSPWHYWADVPIKKQSELHVIKGVYTMGEPKVKYRGIFINDEAPALRNWAAEKFGGFNHLFYEKVFELILRNKGNYLWPAMWQPSAFAADDPENARLADEYGVVISTSHHEPMMRAHDEWERYGGGAWNYETNKDKLQEFWRGGVERMGEYESVVTLGMRGDGDEAMGQETAIGLLQEIISDQRNIISDVTGKQAKETPQVWAIYKEVQDYYDKGMRVDDDILVLFCDDNWGNVRILPKKEDWDHQGGFGMYYHFDFVGGPVSYRWQNVTQIEKVWEQMNLSYEWGVKDLWLVNVGDIKPMELPISFFLDFAWNAESFQAEDLPKYYEKWARQQFGDNHVQDIADILALYTKYSARRTPEMLKPDTYSISNYREADRILKEYDELLTKSKTIYDVLLTDYKAAFYQLVHFPIAVSSNLNDMYVAAGKNRSYAQQGRASTNFYADQVKEKFFNDAKLTEYYHKEIKDGKWNHMMSQSHIGYTSWNNPPVNIMPDIKYIHLPSDAELGYVLEHGKESRRSKNGLYSGSFPDFDPFNDQHYYLEIFNKGKEKLNYSISSKNEWIKISKKIGKVQFDEKVFVSIDWNKVPIGVESGEITISGGKQEFNIAVPIRNNLPQPSGYIENNGIISIEAAGFSNKKDTKKIRWSVIPNLGRTTSSITVEPVNAESQILNKNTPQVAYEFTLFDGGDLVVETYLSPTLNYQKNEGLRYAIAIDDEAPLIVNIHEGENRPDWEYPEWWNTSVTEHVKKKRSSHGTVASGKHILKIFMIDPGVVFQKFVIHTGGLKDTYLGPPESVRME